MGDMTGQVALVTGGIRGIGRAISERLFARGVEVCAGYSHGKEAAEKFAADHPRASVHQGNIGVVEDCERVVQEVLDRHGRLDILVNNAGVSIHTPVGIDDDEFARAWSKTIAVNLTAHALMIRAAFPHLERSPSPRIVNIASTEGLIATGGIPAYTASKQESSG
jgi:acetoacetyl-CoA reductase